MLAKHKKPEINLVKLSSWCTAVINGKEVRVGVRHLGRGKFQIVEAELDIEAKIIDPVDIVRCDVS